MSAGARENLDLALPGVDAEIMREMLSNTCSLPKDVLKYVRGELQSSNIIFGSIVVSILACHYSIASDRGSIPRRRVFWFLY